MSQIDEIYKKLVKNSSWLFAGKSVGSIFSGVQGILIARYLGLLQLGLFSIVQAFVDVLNIFIDLRVWEAATKYVGDHWKSGEKDKACSLIKFFYLIDIITGILAFTVATLTAEIATKYFIKTDGAEVYIYVYAFSLLITSPNTTSQAILRVFDKFKTIAFIGTFQNFVKIVFVIIAILMDKGIYGILVAFVLGNFIGFIINFYYVNLTLNEHGLSGWWKRKIFFQGFNFGEIFRFLFHTSFYGSLKALKDKYLGILILGYFAGKEAAGLYKLARSFLKIISKIADPLYEAIYPELVKVYEGDNISNFVSLIKRATIGMSKIIVPIGIVVFIFADQILSLVYGSEFGLATGVVRILVFAVIISDLASFTSTAFLAVGRPGIRTKIETAALVVYITLLFVLVPVLAQIGAALSLLAFAVVLAILNILYFNKYVIKKGEA